MTRLESKKRGRLLLRLLILVTIAVAAVVSFRTGPQPRVAVEAELPGIGRSTPVEIIAGASGRGLASLRVVLRQQNREQTLLEKQYVSRPSWAFSGPRTENDVVTLQVGSDTIPGLEEGEATLEVEATSPGTWLRSGRVARLVSQYPVLLRPPALGVVSSQHYPAQGGSEVVVYRVGETSTRDGVRAGESWFPGYQLPGGSADMRMAFFAIPFDLDTAEEVRLEAEDALGNSARIAFIDKFFPRPFATDTITVSEKFMAKVVPEIQANTPGLTPGDSLVDDYVAINRDLRRENARILRELAHDSRQDFPWTREFLALPNAKVMSAFADRRKYMFAASEIDQQDHLGFDLASVKRAEVPAANAGLVVLARYFGIYGNTVVIDHGYGLMSLYGHLSSIEVEAGEPVERGQIVGRTGETGLAAGDHLHFTMLLHGEPVTPVEWWDEKWIRDRLKRKLGVALPFSE